MKARAHRGSPWPSVACFGADLASSGVLWLATAIHDRLDTPVDGLEEAAAG